MKQKKKRDELSLPTKALRRKTLIIMTLNVGFFTLLLLSVFIIFIWPIIQWMYDLAKSPLSGYLLKVWYIGIPILSFAIVYGSVLFWPLLVKFNRIRYKGHDICIYLGIKNVIVNIDGKNVTYLTHGFFSCPVTTWYIEIGNDEYITINVLGKTHYKVELNSQPTEYHQIALSSDNVIKLPKKNKK